MDKFEFSSGPDSMVAELRHYSDGPLVRQMNVNQPYISFHGTGPRGGWVGGPVISVETMEKLDDMIAKAKGWPYRCKGCGRAEDDCSAEPCAEVIADREDSWTDEPVGPAPIMPPDFTDDEKADMKHNAQMLDGCETEDELNAELRAQTQGN